MVTLYLFLVSLFIGFGFLVFYTYVGYGLIVWGLVKIRRKRPSAILPAERPPVTLVVAAYNERDCLPQKVQNCLHQDYPADRLHILFVIEGSTDGSAEYLAQQHLPNLRILSGHQRLGKIAAINKAMQQVHTPITIFTDANTQLNKEAVSRLVSRFTEGVGAVTGEKRIQTDNEEAAAGSGEGLYWRYESFLKRLDAELHTIVGAAGELFAIRTDLYETVEPDTLLDDFVISLRIAGRGYRVDYAPDAYALERPSHSVSEEKKRKVRIATGGFQAMKRLAYLLNIGRYGWLSFQYVSHRVLRWAVAPFCLPLLLLVNGLILILSQTANLYPAAQLFWGLIFLSQSFFYAAAYVGYLRENRHTRWKLTFVPFYFVFMNWCVLLGFARFNQGHLSGVWEKAKRAT